MQLLGKWHRQVGGRIVLRVPKQTKENMKETHSQNWGKLDLSYDKAALYALQHGRFSGGR